MVVMRSPVWILMSDDDHGLARQDEGALAELGHRGGDGLVRVVREVHAERLDAADEQELAARRAHIREGVDHGPPRPVARDELAELAAPGDDDDGARVERVGEPARAPRDVLALRPGRGPLLVQAQRGLALDAARDAVEHLDAADRVVAGGRLAAQHDRVRLLVDRVGDVGDLGAGRHRVVHHRLEQVRRDDDGLAGDRALADHLALQDRQLLEGDLHPEVTARDHDGVGRREDGVEIVDPLLVLDLGHEPLVAPGRVDDAAHLLDVLRAANERQRDEVDVLLDRERDVLAVLLRDRREVHADARQVHVLAGAKRAAVEHPTLQAVRQHLEHLEVDEPVVDGEPLADLEVFDEIPVVDMHAAKLAVVGQHREVEDLAGLQLDVLPQLARADLGALQIHQDRHRPAVLLAEALQVPDDL